MLTAIDLFALSLLCAMMLSLSAIFSLFFIISRKAKKATELQNASKKLEKLSKPLQDSPNNNTPKNSTEEWVKDPDWWKNGN